MTPMAGGRRGCHVSCRHRHPPGGTNDPGAAGAWVWVRQRVPGSARAGPAHETTRDQPTYMNAPYASLSIHDNAKVKIAPVHSDCECSFWLRSLMGSAGWRLDRLHALWVLRSARAWSTTVLPVLPSLHDRLSNRWYFSLKSLCGLLLRGWPSVTRPRPPSCNPSRSAGHGQAAPRRFEHSCWPARPPRHSCCAAAPLR